MWIFRRFNYIQRPFWFVFIYHSTATVQVGIYLHLFNHFNFLFPAPRLLEFEQHCQLHTINVPITFQYKFVLILRNSQTDRQTTAAQPNRHTGRLLNGEPIDTNSQTARKPLQIWSLLAPSHVASPYWIPNVFELNSDMRNVTRATLDRNRNDTRAHFECSKYSSPI